MERAIRALRRTEIAQPYMRLACQPLQERHGQARLADARLARKQNDLAHARLRYGPAPIKEFALFFTPDQGRQPARVQRLEAALLRTLPQRRVGARRSGDPLEVLRAEIDQLEKVAQQLARALGNDDAVGFGDPLQPRGEVRRVAHDPAFPRFSRTKEIADHHDPRRDPHPHMQRAACCLKFRHGLDDRMPGPDGALGVMLMRLRIAEIGQHAVAHVFSDEAALARNQSRAALVIGRDDAPHILGIEPRGKLGRADEVAEHHRELAALCGIRRRARIDGRRWTRAGIGSAQTGNRPEKPLPMPEGEHAELLKIGVAQVNQNVAVNTVLAERRFILAEPEAPQPIPHVHRSVSYSCS